MLILFVYWAAIVWMILNLGLNMWGLVRDRNVFERFGCLVGLGFNALTLSALVLLA